MFGWRDNSVAASLCLPRRSLAKVGRGVFDVDANNTATERGNYSVSGFDFISEFAGWSGTIVNVRVPPALTAL